MEPVIQFKGTRIAKVDFTPNLGIELHTGLTFLRHVQQTRNNKAGPNIMLLGPDNKARNLFGEVGRLLKVTYGVKHCKSEFSFQNSFSNLLSWCTPQAPGYTK